jgi:hypothetical protein
MKGTVSPELRAILNDPEMRRRFVAGYSGLDASGKAVIDLGSNRRAVVTRLSAIRPSSAKRKGVSNFLSIFKFARGK